ncbi:MAG: hypothetical protein ACFFE4_15485 [Candidatus Thorarchaeota archaeon]
MEHQKIIKFLKIVGLIFICLSIIEIIFVIWFHFIQFDLNGSPVLLSEFIYGSSYITLTGTVLWFFYIFAIILYLILGFFIIKTAKVNTIHDKSLAKLKIALGMVILLGALVKMFFFVLLGKTPVSTGSGTVTFQTALYSPDVTTLTPAILWNFFMSVNTYYMIIGLIIAVFGIKWTLQIEDLEGKKE